MESPIKFRLLLVFSCPQFRNSQLGRNVILFRFSLVLSLLVFFCARSEAQTRIVELTVYAGPGNQAGAQQEWMRLLSEVDVDRVTSEFRAGAKPSIGEEEFGGSTVVTVKGVLRNGRLELPGKRFSRSDVAGVTRYLQRLREDKADVAMAEKKAFGLTEIQLREAHVMLAKEVVSSTMGVSPIQAVETLLNDARLEVQMDRRIRHNLASGEKLLDERKGVSVGTALASILIESDAGLVPYRPAGGSIQFRIVDSAETNEVWPTGWPSEQAPVALEPRLFQRQDIRIERFPLGDALTAVAKRCGATVLYNRAAVSKHGINLAQTEVAFTRKQVTYMVTFGKLLRQSDPPMDIEVRVDEAGNPFAWIDVRK